MRLIDADQFKAKLLGLMDRKALTPSDTDCILDGVLNLLDEQPTIDPVKYGRWVNRSPLGTAICSICGYCADSVYTDRYCRHCGAKLDGEAEC